MEDGWTLRTGMIPSAQTLLAIIAVKHLHGLDLNGRALAVKEYVMPSLEGEKVLGSRQKADMGYN